MDKLYKLEYEKLDISRLDIWGYASNFALKNSVFEMAQDLLLHYYLMKLEYGKATLTIYLGIDG